MRLFIGIKLDNRVNSIINKICDNLYNEGIRGNYTNKNNIHLTLSFLGEINESKEKEITEVIDSLDVTNIKEIKITGISVLKDMIILNVEKSKELDCLYNELYNKLINLNYKLDNRHFFPHITLVREKNKDYKKGLELVSTFTKVTLFESKRINGVLTYVPLN